MKRATLAGLNAAMQKESIAATLYKGAGYFYFSNYGENVYDMDSIYIYAMNQCTHDEFMEHVRDSWNNRRTHTRRA